MRMEIAQCTDVLLFQLELFQYEPNFKLIYTHFGDTHPENRTLYEAVNEQILT